MENIISQSNGKVRTVVRLLSGPKERKYLGRYVVEGTRMVREIPDKDLDSIFMTQAYYDKFMGEDVRIRYLVEKAVLRGRCYIVTDIILRKMSDTKHPQGIVATVNTKSYTVEELMQSGNLFARKFDMDIDADIISAIKDKVCTDARRSE